MANINSLQKGLIFHAPLDGEHLAKDVTPYGNDGGKVKRNPYKTN